MSTQRHGPPGQSRDRPPDDFWASYLKNGYFDEAGNLLARLVVEDAHEVAHRLAQGRTRDSQGLAPGQLRRFYNKAKALEQKVDAGVSFAALVSELRTLQPLAAEAVAKEKAPPEFKTFIDKNLKWAATDQKSFQQGFLVHFQSVVAYFAYEKKTSGGGR